LQSFIFTVSESPQQIEVASLSYERLICPNTGNLKKLRCIVGQQTREFVDRDGLLDLAISMEFLNMNSAHGGPYLMPE
jgi:hypothetical protein